LVLLSVVSAFGVYLRESSLASFWWCESCAMKKWVQL